MKKLINRLLFKFVHQQWNIGIADRNDDLTLSNIKWMRHHYSDRWFADPFIVDETVDSYIILVEEFLRDEHKGRLARLTVSKSDCTLMRNETILDLPTHLSFPNAIIVDEKTYVYPENGASGHTQYYVYDEVLSKAKCLSDLPLADAVIFKHEDNYYLFYTMSESCNGNVLHISVSKEVFGNYRPLQDIVFPDNIARRAGNVFEWNGKMIFPAQICNHNYGEGVSFQELYFSDNKIELKELFRMAPPTNDYPNGFHTYNVWKDKVVLDGYRYGSNLLHKLYFLLRGLDE